MAQETIVCTPVNSIAGDSLDIAFGKVNRMFTEVYGGTAAATPGSFSGSLTGYATPLTGTVTYRVTGGVAFLQLQGLFGTSNATTMTLTGAPAALFPLTAKTVLVNATDNGTAALATGVIGTNGVITFSKGLGLAGAWTASGTKGVAQLQIQYSLD